MGPSTIYDKVFEEAGGMIEVEGVSNAPRNIKQVKSARATLKRISSDEDEFYVTKVLFVIEFQSTFS